MYKHKSMQSLFICRRKSIGYREDYENGVSVVCKDTPWQNEGRNKSKVITGFIHPPAYMFAFNRMLPKRPWTGTDICAQYFIDHRPSLEDQEWK